MCPTSATAGVSMRLTPLFARACSRVCRMSWPTTSTGGFSTPQFQSLSVSPQHPTRLIQGGTQDNGTWQIGGTEDEGSEDNAASSVWHRIIYGDGGQSGFSSTNDALRFNTFTGQANDANFRNGDPTKWVIISAPIVNSPEGAFFYPPVIADPHPANGGTIFEGSFSVWRTQDWGGDRAYLEANCPEFTTFAGQADCGDFVTIGPAGATDLTAPGIYGNTRPGTAVAWIQRTPSNTGTVWVATGAGRVFVSDNANAAAGSVVWNRVDPVINDPGRFISSIAIDPKKATLCVDLLLGLQRQHAGHTGTRVCGDLDWGGTGDMGRSQLQPV